MANFDRWKKRDLLSHKSLVHFSLCFSLGLFSGLVVPGTPPTTPPISLFSYQPSDQPDLMPGPILSSLPPKLIIVITPIGSGDPTRDAMLTRISRTLRLVPPPVVWIVVGPRAEAVATAEALRMTGTVYRQLVIEEMFADAETEMEHLRNAALRHVEQHRLDGIVHFAELDSVYDLQFFRELREIEVFGTWPTASVSANHKRVTVEGPVCKSSGVLGWHLNGTSTNGNNRSSELGETRQARLGISTFAFNSSILWDREKWDRSSSDPDNSQDSTKFVQKVMMEDERKLKGFPTNCSRVLLWRLHIPRNLGVQSTLPVDHILYESYY